MLGYAVAAFVLASATYFHPSLSGEIMRGGEPYDPSLGIVAVGVDDSGAPSLPMETVLLVCAAPEETGREALGAVGTRIEAGAPVWTPGVDGGTPVSGPGTCVTGVVADTGRFPVGDLDLSESIFNQLAPLSKGRIKVEYTVIQMGE